MTANTFLQVIASVAAKETKLDNSYINITLKGITDNENGNQLINWKELKKIITIITQPIRLLFPSKPFQKLVKSPRKFNFKQFY